MSVDLAPWRTAVAGADAGDWITVAAYVASAVLAHRAAAAAGRKGAPGEARFWTLCALMMIALGINEVFDFQMLLTQLGRTWAQALGLTGQRRLLQAFFILGLAVVVVAAGIATVIATRRMDGAIRLALAGLASIAAFVMIRAISLHHVDALLGMGAGWVNIGAVQEWIGIAIVAAAAARYCQRQALLARSSASNP
jgi:hypothetical protein